MMNGIYEEAIREDRRKAREWGDLCQGRLRADELGLLLTEWRHRGFEQARQEVLAELQSTVGPNGEQEPDVGFLKALGLIAHKLEATLDQEKEAISEVDRQEEQRGSAH